MFENIINFFKNFNKKQEKTTASNNSKDAAKERLHLVLMQDRANVSADFLELMKQEIIEVIKKYIDVDESAIDVRLTNKENEDGTNGAPALYANIPILNIKNEARQVDAKKEEKGKEEIKENKENKENKEFDLKTEKSKTEKEDSEEEKDTKVIIDSKDVDENDNIKEDENKSCEQDDQKDEDKKTKDEVKSEN